VDAAAALGAGGSSPSPWSVVCNQHSEHQVAEPHSRRSCWLSSGRDVEVAEAAWWGPQLPGGQALIAYESELNGRDPVTACPQAVPLGVDPGPEAQRLEAAILGQDVALSPQPPRRSSAGPRTPCVGRERELATLLAHFVDAEAGRGRITFLAGEAGIGKSRLLAEVAAGAAGRGAQVFAGRCLEGSPPRGPQTIAGTTPSPTALTNRRGESEQGLAAAATLLKQGRRTRRRTTGGREACPPSGDMFVPTKTPPDTRRSREAEWRR
jgi:AAA ATPase domain